MQHLFLFSSHQPAASLWMEPLKTCLYHVISKCNGISHIAFPKNAGYILIIKIGKLTCQHVFFLISHHMSCFCTLQKKVTCNCKVKIPKGRLYLNNVMQSSKNLSPLCKYETPKQTQTSFPSLLSINLIKVIKV